MKAMKLVMLLLLATALAAGAGPRPASVAVLAGVGDRATQVSHRSQPVSTRTNRFIIKHIYPAEVVNEADPPWLNLSQILVFEK